MDKEAEEACKTSDEAKSYFENRRFLIRFKITSETSRMIEALTHIMIQSQEKTKKKNSLKIGKSFSPKEFLC